MCNSRHVSGALSAAQVDIDTVEKFEELRALEKQYFTDMVQQCKDSGATLVICQWGFDDEANHLLLAHDLPGAATSAQPLYTLCISRNSILTAGHGCEAVVAVCI